jgi:hypothetical protein
MVPFKPSVHRLYFIDKKIRENTYPTTVSIAADYRAKYGQSVVPRTIAADIACLKERFHAPLCYNYQKRGYFYTNTNFQLPVLEEDADNLLPTMAAELHPRTASIPEWQQTFLASLVDKVLPLAKARLPSKGKVSVLLDDMGDDAEAGVKQSLLKALDDNAAVRLLYAFSGKKPYASLVFKPVHLICALEFNLVFGTIADGQKNRYALLYLDRIKEVSIRNEVSAPPDYIYIQTTHSHDIEVVITQERSDLLLVFTLQPEGEARKPLPEYVLLAQTEIFTSF